MPGGTELMYYCNNLQTKTFATTIDVRQCPLPNDIKNCDGVLTCTQSPTTQCPSKN